MSNDFQYPFAEEGEASRDPRDERVVTFCGASLADGCIVAREQFTAGPPR